MKVIIASHTMSICQEEYLPFALRATEKNVIAKIYETEH